MFVKRLDEVNKESVLLAGGKAANLGELIKIGIPVPGGFVITSEAYNYFVEENDLQKEIEMMETCTEDEQLKGFAEKIEKKIQERELPIELQSEILKNYSLVGNNVRVAVRSSATTEDLEDASFAGQQETFLNVVNEKMLLEKIKECYASLWGYRAIMYRKEKGYAKVKSSLAVVVQEMIESDVAGVVFTMNPSSGNHSELLINSSFGLGEAVVSGKVTPDSFITDRRGKELQYIKGSKEISIVYDEKGTKIVQNSKEKQEETTLNRNNIKELVKICLKIENHYGYPMDIEWAIKDNRIYILQARAITTNNQYKISKNKLNRTEKKIMLFMLEHCPRAYYPLDFDLGMVLADSKEELFRKLGINMGCKLVMDERGIITLSSKRTSLNSSIIKLPIQIKEYLNQKENEELGEKGLQECEKILKKYEKVDFSSIGFEQCLEMFKELFELEKKIAFVRFRYFIFSAVLLGATFKKYFNKIDHKVNEYDLLSGLPYKTWLINKKMGDLAEKVKENQSFSEMILNRENIETIKKSFPDEWKLIEEYLDEFGWKSDYSCYPFSGRSWNEEPERFLMILSAVIKSGKKQEMNDSKIVELKKEIKNQVSEKKYKKIERDFEYYRRCHIKREETQYLWEMCFGMCRNVLRELELKIYGKEEKNSDLMYLRIDELYSVCEAGGITEELMEKMKIRKSARKEAESAWQQLLSLVLDSEKDDLKGISGSAGVAKGRVCIVNEVSEFNKMQKGDILVCRFTDPEWTPLFTLASAVIADTGGALSHAAIVAREYGIPAVLGVGNATSKLKDGDYVLVDGTNGKIVFVEERGID